MNDFRAQPAKAVRAATAEIDQRHDCRTEQQRIDAVKIVIVTLENLAERLAVVGRRNAGNPRTEVLQLGIIRSYPQRYLATVQDRVISERSYVGSSLSRLEVALSNLSATRDNYLQAAARIMDGHYTTPHHSLEFASLHWSLRFVLAESP